MGFFDRLKAKGQAAGPIPSTPSAPDPNAAALPRLAAARQKLDAKDLPGALAIYDEVLQTSGDRADVLVTISGDLGATGHIAPIVELVAPRYDAERHGPATGINLVQAYLALRDPEAAQHVLDILFSLNRPELEQRLHGFSNAIADLMTHGDSALLPPIAEAPVPFEAPKIRAVALISISKPIWAYGLEPMFPELLVPKGQTRKVAFAQLALPGAYPQPEEAMRQPPDALGRLSRALPLWLAETFCYAPHYAPIAAVGNVDEPDGSRHPMIFPAEWTTENLRQLVSSAPEGVDYAFTGSLQAKDGATELLLRVWEIKKMKERKQFSARWTASTATAELTKLHHDVRTFMEWSPAPAGTGLPYVVPVEPAAWLDFLSASLDLFLAEKALMPVNLLPSMVALFDDLAPHASNDAAASLSWLTLLARARKLGIAPSLATIQLSLNPLVAKAQASLA